ncbi:MAG: hypothetical protein J6V07_04455, partial [Clostridia bacterium]|nr:hypothetical protein [Clostridia bacterium]
MLFFYLMPRTPPEGYRTFSQQTPKELLKIYKRDAPKTEKYKKEKNPQKGVDKQKNICYNSGA